MTTQHVLILGSGAAGAAAARTLASRDDVRVTLVTRTGETPYTRMLIKGIAFGQTPPEMIKLPLPQIEVIADTVLKNYDGFLKVDGEVGNKKVYDPRSYLKKAEQAMSERVVEACNDLKSAGRSVSAG